MFIQAIQEVEGKSDGVVHGFKPTYNKSVSKKAPKILSKSEKWNQFIK